MIVTYPMLTSTSVSPSAVPGICKALERYIMIYRMNDIIKAVQSGKGLNLFLGSKKRLFLKEKKDSKFFSKPEVVDSKEEREKERHGWEKEKWESREKEAEKEEAKEKRKEEDRVKKASVSISMPDSKSLSIEPSFIVVSTGAGPAPLGIKVVSYPVKSDVTLAALLTNDQRMSWFESALATLDRRITQLLWKIFWKVWLNLPIIKWFASRSTVSGDPKKDILVEKSAFGARTLACVNYMDLQDDFFKRPGRLKRLARLGWKDIVVTDDVNKQAHFILTSLKGLYSTVPYSFLYATIGKEEVYNSLDDVRRASGPLFRMKGKVSKLFGESVAAVRKASYSNRGK